MWQGRCQNQGSLLATKKILEKGVVKQFGGGRAGSRIGCNRPGAGNHLRVHPEARQQRGRHHQHFSRECPLIDVGKVVRVAGPPAPSSSVGGTYSVLVRIHHLAMLDSGCTQSMILQNLVRTGELLEYKYVKSVCVHDNVHRYPVIRVE